MLRAHTLTGGVIPNPFLYTTDQVCERLAVHKVTLYRWIEDRKVPQPTEVEMLTPYKPGHLGFNDAWIERVSSLLHPFDHRKPQPPGACRFKRPDLRF
jgi:hypothetical protein